MIDLVAGIAAAVAGPTVWGAFDMSYDPRGGLVVWLVTFPVVWVIALWLVGAHEPARSHPGASAARLVGQAVLLVGVILALIFFFRPFFVPRGSSLVGLAFVAPLTLLTRSAYSRRVGRLRRGAAVVLGTDVASLRLADELNHSTVGLRIAAFLAPTGPMHAVSPDAPVLDLDHGIWNAVRETSAEVILVGRTRGLPSEVLADLARCYEHEVEAIPATAYYEDLTGRVMAGALEADWYADLPTRTRGLYPLVKRAVDILGASLLLVLLSPLMAVVAVVIAVDSGTPMFLRQTRVGAKGRPFSLHKFRSMEPGAEAEGRPVWAADRDARVTRVGRTLRQRRLDELPQLWDVLRGTMSLIGPRPERPEFAERLASELPLYSARALVRPGLTGWAQVRYPYARTIEENLAKLEYDLYYVRHLGPFLDLTIAVRTVFLLLGLGGPARGA